MVRKGETERKREMQGERKGKKKKNYPPDMHNPTKPELPTPPLKS
jgi:hypothetical protein